MGGGGDGGDGGGGNGGSGGRRAQICLAGEHCPLSTNFPLPQGQVEVGGV